ncbi:PEP-CTERM sorting domain-containing protein [Oceanicoccus sagamiensis]|uniref:Ice-binding protein C-terminal domain-containing protein n=1 Tax=Oceanicoccus sagamiensis TaxID=716816 RepID=A0A1X9NC24_9GAMM|nr:PEP-CTERM sorting domain-containing protein [Oceanicoccus sagamiensis]ARN74594.1 hypothetical protein BST96_10955 [Oceanicoccus sagamiensis]
MKLQVGKLLVTATAMGSIAANAAVITIDSGSEAALNAIEATFQSGLAVSVLEDFDGLGDATAVSSSNEQDAWEATANSFSTNVGTFTLDIAGQAGGNVNNGNLMIESDQTGEFGRESLSSDDNDFWLDSNDAGQVTWSIFDNLSSTAIDFDSIGFFLSDPNDQGARLNLIYDDGTSTSEQIDTGYSSDSLFYVTIQAASTIASASLVFENCVDVNSCDSLDPNDGWGIDDVVIGASKDPRVNEVPEPGSIALLALGVAGLGLARRKKA